MHLIPPIEDGLVNVIIETPKGSQNKYHYDEQRDVFLLKKVLPMGFAFPFDFGFVPNTISEDGDPLDIIVILDEHTYPGCLVQCRLIGALEAEQIEKTGKKNRNDRLVAVSGVTNLYDQVQNVHDLGSKTRMQTEGFFIAYNSLSGKQFMPLRWVDAPGAHQLLQAAIK